MTLTGNTFYFPWEVSLMEWLQSHIGEAGISVLSFFSSFGEEIFLLLVFGTVYWGFNKRQGRTLGLTVLMGTVWGPMIKNIALRRRPYFDSEGIKILRVVEPEADIYDIAAQGYSFPSGHSTNAAALFGSLAKQFRKKWFTALAFVMPLLVGVSRVVVGAHYPTDVLGGWALGTLALLLVPALEKRLGSTVKFYGALLLLSVPGFFYCKSADYFSCMGLLVGFMGGTLLEEKAINFENTKNVLRIVLRLLGGFAIYFALNKLLKLPFSKEFLDSGTFAALMVRFARYALIAFIGFGVYPLIFKFTAKFWTKKDHAGVSASA